MRSLLAPVQKLCYKISFAVYLKLESNLRICFNRFCQS